jgi:hypothetical protein
MGRVKLSLDRLWSTFAINGLILLVFSSNCFAVETTIKKDKIDKDKLLAEILPKEMLDYVHVFRTHGAQLAKYGVTLYDENRRDLNKKNNIDGLDQLVIRAGVKELSSQPEANIELILKW